MRPVAPIQTRGHVFNDCHQLLRGNKKAARRLLRRKPQFSLFRHELILVNIVQRRFADFLLVQESVDVQQLEA